MVTKSIPPNSVAVGVPAKVICPIEEYYDKIKKQYAEEAIDYAISIKERINREPIVDDFTDDYPCFVDGSNINEYSKMPYHTVLKEKHFERWKKNHTAVFNGFENFMTETNKRVVDHE